MRNAAIYRSAVGVQKKRERDSEVITSLAFTEPFTE
jgi:hypothetical protein